MMKRLLCVAAIVIGMGTHFFVTAPPAHAHGCSGMSLAYEGCRRFHAPWTNKAPEPLVSWGVFTGKIRADILGDFGSASIMECSVVAGSGKCSMTRQEPLQCCVEPWSLVCLAVGIGSWSCDHM